MTLNNCIRSVLLLVLTATRASAGPVEIETVYVVPFTHNDVGFDATPKQMAANSAESVDDAIEQAAVQRGSDG